MVELFYSNQDGIIRMTHENCPLELLMNGSDGCDGFLIFADNDVFEIVEYIEGGESSFTTKVLSKSKNSESDFINVNEFFYFIEKMVDKC